MYRKTDAQSCGSLFFPTRTPPACLTHAEPLIMSSCIPIGRSRSRAGSAEDTGMEAGKMK